MPQNSLALAGIRVADFTRVLAGPYATMMLGDLGAEVIKIESPLGDETRSWKPPVDPSGEATYFSAVNRNKRSLVCDLGTPGGLARALTLAGTADVVVENFRPGTMKRFGLDYESLRALNPGVVFCSITGFGSGSDIPGYDLVAQAVGGLMSITGPIGGDPHKAGVALVDVLAGSNAVIGVLAALRERESTGRGQLVEVNLLSSLLAALSNQASSTLATGLPPQRQGNAHPSIAPYELFHAADRPLVIAVGNDTQFRALAEVVGDTTMPDDPRFAANELRVHNRVALAQELNRRLAAGTAEEWVVALMGRGVPAGVVNDILGAFEVATELGLQPIVEMTIGTASIRQVANPIRFSRTPAAYRLPPPPLGAHEDATWIVRAER